MAQVIFKQGNKVNLPKVGVDKNTLFFVNDHSELYKSVGAGLPLSRIGDIKIVDVLPTTDILTDKIYLLVKDSNIEIYLWEDGWKTIVSGGTVVDDVRVDILFNLKNKKDILTYDADGNIIKLTTTGDVQSEIDYTYDSSGNIISETIKRQGHISVNTFSYDDNENIIEINTNVSKLQQ